MEKDIFKTKTLPLPGSNYSEICKGARSVFGEMKSRTKRKIHVRSAYFKKQKVFFDYFWDHLLEKRPPDRIRRLRLLPCAIEVIINSRHKPEEIHNIEGKKREIFYRFYGITQQNQKFVIQIKKNVTKNSLQFISVFPIK